MLPLEAFVVTGAFIEELIGPIPSPLVLTSAGSIAHTQGHTGWYVVLLALIGGFGKVLAAWLLYIIGDKAESWIVGRWGRLFGLSHETVTGLSKKLGNKGIWDDIVLFMLRALPFMPAAPVSVLCGILRMPIKPYLISTFLGYSVRNAFFLFVGYLGISAYHKMVRDMSGWEMALWIVCIIAVIVAGIWLYTNAKRSWWDRLYLKFKETLRRLRLMR